MFFKAWTRFQGVGPPSEVPPVQKAVASLLTVAALVAGTSFIGLSGGLDASLSETTSDSTSGLVLSVHDTGRGGAEPTIGVTSDGAIFFQAYSTTVRSDDGGGSWQPVSTFASSPLTFDPYLWVDQTTDRVYTVQLYLGCSYLSYSDDGGQTWVTNPAACGVPVNDHQKFATGPSALLPDQSEPADNVVGRVGYYCSNQLTHTTCTATHDGGLTFAPGWSLIFHCGGLNGQPHVSPTTGTAFVPYIDCGRPGIALTRNDGATWTKRRGPTDEGGVGSDPDLAVDADGVAYMAYRGSDHRPYLIVSEDDGETWRGPYPLAPPEVGSSAFVAVAAGDRGRIGWAFIGTEDATGDPTDAPDAAEWHLYAGVSTDADRDPPTLDAVQVTPDVDPVQIGSICLGGLSCGADRNLLDFIDAQAGPEGRLHVAYADGCTPGCRSGDAPGASRDDQGIVAIVREGPSLLADRTIADGNGAPTAAFTATADGLTVDLDSGASTDPDGDDLWVHWDLGDGSESFRPTLEHTYDAAGTYTVTLTVHDGSRTDVVQQDITVTDDGDDGSSFTGILKADFEEGLPEGWTVEDAGGPGVWQVQNAPGRPGLVAAISPYGAGEDDRLLSGPVDLAGTVAPYVNFTHLANGHALVEPVAVLVHLDYGTFAVSTDAGASWDVLATNISGTPGWDQATFDLTPYAGQTVHLAWHWTSDDVKHDAGWFVDDVVVDDAG